MGEVGRGGGSGGLDAAWRGCSRRGVPFLVAYTYLTRQTGLRWLQVVQGFANRKTRLSVTFRNDTASIIPLVYTTALFVLLLDMQPCPSLVIDFCVALSGFAEQSRQPGLHPKVLKFRLQ